MAGVEGGGVRSPVLDSEGRLVLWISSCRKVLSHQAVDGGGWCFEENLKPETVSFKRTGCSIRMCLAYRIVPHTERGELDIERCTLFLKEKTHIFFFYKENIFFFKQKYLEKREKLHIKKWTRGLIKALEHSCLGYKYMVNERNTGKCCWGWKLLVMPFEARPPGHPAPADGHVPRRCAYCF